MRIFDPKLTGSIEFLNPIVGSITGSLFGTASYAITASYALNGGSGTTFPYTGTAVISGSLVVTGSTNLIGNTQLTGGLLVSGGYISQLQYIDFVTSSAPPHREGRLHFTEDTKTIQIDTDVTDFMIELGHQNVVRVRNENAFTLTKGKIVYMSGSSGNRPLVYTSSVETDRVSAATLGVVAQNILQNNNGYVITNGIIRNLNTNAYLAGQMLYLSTSGDWGTTAPEAPLHEVRIGKVITTANDGMVYIDIMNGYEIGELHDVVDINGEIGDLLVRSGSSPNNVFRNTKQLTGSYGVTGSLNILGGVSASSGFTGSLFGTASYTRNLYITASSTAPVSPTDNELWYDADTGKTYIRFNDGTSTQWVLQSDPTIDINTSLQNLQEVTDLGSTTTNVVTITNTTNATDSSSGAFVVDGGAGFGLDVWARKFYGDGSGLTGITATTVETDTLQSVTTRGNETSQSVFFTNTTNASSKTVGALRVSGGIAVEQDVFAERVRATSFTGSLFGTASFVTGSIFTSTNRALSASYSVSSSFALTASYVANASSFPYTGSAVITGSLIVTGSVNVDRGVTGSLLGTASYAIQALTASYVVLAQTASVAGAVNTSNGTSTTFQNIPTILTGAGYRNLDNDSGNKLRYRSSDGLFSLSGSQIISSSGGVTLTVVGSVSASLGFTGSLLGTASYSVQGLSASFASTASYILNAISSSFSSTASYVNPLNQGNVIITGSLYISGSGANSSLIIGGGATSSAENVLSIGIPAGGSAGGEGGQISLQAPNSGGYTSASMIDNYQNQTRLLRGTNAGSDAVVASFNMHTKQFSIPAYNSTTAFTGTTLVGLLGFDANGNVLTTNTGSGGGGTSVNITNNTDNYILTATGTANSINGESNLQFNGSTLSVTGNVTATTVTSSGAFLTLANNAMYFRGGDDAEFWDINLANTVGVYGQQDQGVASIKLGSGGGVISGRSGSIGINTITPSNSTNLDVVGVLNVSGTFLVTGSARFTGSVSATQGGFTGSLFGTSSWALNVVGGVGSSITIADEGTAQGTATFINFIGDGVTATVSSNTASINISGGTGATFPYTGSAQITGSLGVTGSVAIKSTTGDAFVIFSSNGSTNRLFYATSSAASGLVRLGDLDNALNGIYLEVDSQNEIINANGSVSVNNDLRVNQNLTIGGPNSVITGSLTISGSQKITGSSRILGDGTDAFEAFGNINNYFEIYAQNLSNGVSASTDIVAYNDQGNKTQNYVDMGINSSGISSTYSFGRANDAYVYNTGGDLFIGNSTAFYQPSRTSQSLHLFANAPGIPDLTITGSRIGIQKSSNLNATLDVLGNVIISGALHISGSSLAELKVLGDSEFTGSITITNRVVAQSFTGSLLGSASYALTASYAANGGVTQIVAGTNISLSPTNGLGVVTINSEGGAAFPFEGEAVITGSILLRTGSAIFPTLTASETLAAGDFVNIFSGGVRKASNDDVTKQAHGFVIQAYSATNPVDVFYSGVNIALTGLTAGSVYFLGTSGGETTTPPTAANQLNQQIGVAISTTNMLVNFGPAIIT